jgi:hypothetical protein
MSLQALIELVDRSPDVRIGQLLVRLGMMAEEEFDRSLWDVDDDQFQSICERQRRELTERTIPVLVDAA